MSEFKIQIQDFQSLSNVNMVIEDGLTVIVGKTNEGKTAIIRAIESAIFNVGNDDFVTIGKRYSYVSLNNGDSDLKWRRDNHGKNEKTTYVIDGGKPIVKVGRVQLEEVANRFKITAIRLANGVKEKINFWYQDNAPFLTDKTEGQLFDFLSQSSCKKYITVLRSMAGDVKALKSNIDQTNVRIDILRKINSAKKSFIEKNKNYEELYTRVLAMNIEVTNFNTLSTSIDRYNSLVARIHIKTKNLETVAETLKGYDLGSVKVQYEDIINLNTSQNSLNVLLEDYSQRTSRKDTLTKKCTKISNTLAKKSFSVTKADRDLQDILERVSEVDTLKVLVDSVKLKKSKHKTLKASLSSIKLKIDNIDVNSFIDEIVDIENEGGSLKTLKGLMDSYNLKKSRLDVKESDLQSTTQKYTASCTEFDTFKVSIGTCPYCESSLGGCAC